VPRVDARARWAAASPPVRRSQELSGGGCNPDFFSLRAPVVDPMPASPRLIAGLSSSASAGPIGCTSGRDAFELGALDFGGLTGFLGVPGCFAITGIWDESGRHKRAKAPAKRRRSPRADACYGTCIARRADDILTISKWIPPHRVHRRVQYSEDRPGMTRMTVRRASHCGQLERVAAGSDPAGLASLFSGMVVKAVVKTDIWPLQMPLDQENMFRSNQM
jgi:hypothetical protein